MGGGIAVVSLQIGFKPSQFDVVDAAPVFVIAVETLSFSRQEMEPNISH
jgi:hypothetical protein